MYVDINLLPSKKKRLIKPSLLYSLLLLVFSCTLFWLYIDYQQTSHSLEKILKDTQVIELKNEELLAELANETESEKELLQENIHWIESIKISTFFLLNHLVSLLPERGFFVDYQYSDDGKITIAVMFDTIRESSQYLYELTESLYISDAKFLTITAQPLSEQDSTSDGDNILPRYQANYELTINESALREVKKQEK
ncbi:hypothetical protein [Bacillus taeanensis]|uniref:Fimbrial assembly protein n=1 Tax=Bacillus taeanensis TaxID=273032 RepID=A0A366XYV9_9BACI|nr:hypothetical protein [Bacillus taeanensis]RBW71590.1 hypothetical protein DS031_02250 [Bacillus taeanensis]